MKNNYIKFLSSGILTTIQDLKRKGFKVSVDSANDQELLRGGRGGADYVLSLSERNIHIAGKIKSIPVLIPSSPGDLDSLYRVAKKFESFIRRWRI